MLSCGDTFLLPKNSNATEHLWIILSAPSSDGKAVCVNVTSERANCDTTVTLAVGDHPFITKPSVIYFEDARMLDLNKVQEVLDAKHKNFVAQPSDSCHPDLLNRIRQGLLQSKFTPREMKNHCKQLWA